MTKEELIDEKSKDIAARIELSANLFVARVEAALVELRQDALECIDSHMTSPDELVRQIGLKMYMRDTMGIVQTLFRLPK